MSHILVHGVAVGCNRARYLAEKTTADKGYVSVLVAIKRRAFGSRNRARDALITALRAPDGRADTVLIRKWTTHELLTLDPGQASLLTAAGIVLSHYRDQSGENTSVVTSVRAGGSY